ncbi:MAG: hypothetical protein ACKOF9_04285 [Burkholderiales bacterium]
MKFTLDAGGAQAAGQGIGNMFKAYAMGDQYRQQAEQDTIKTAADIYYRQMAGKKYGAEAEGLEMTNRARTAPVDNTLPYYLQIANKLFQATGDTNMERIANAGTALQTQGIRDQAVQSLGDVDKMNRLNTLAKPGEVYMPYKAVGDTGAAIDQATGGGKVFDPVLHKLFGDESVAKVARDRGAANSSNAAAGKYRAEADVERLKGKTLRETGSLPGTRSAGGRGDQSIDSAIDDARAEYNMRYPLDMTGKRKGAPEYDSFLRNWLIKRGIPVERYFGGAAAGDKNPAAPTAAPKIDAKELPKNKAELKAGSVYQTARGPAKWNGSVFESID